MIRWSLLRREFVVFLALLLAACATSGPDYQRPAVETPLAYKRADGFRAAEPRDTAPRGPWWEMFGDAHLNGLVAQVEVSNFNVQLAAAQYRQAQALSDAARAAFAPVVGGALSATRSGAPGVAASGTTTRAALNVAWEADVWGRLSRSAEARVASVEASAADLGAALLSAQALLVRNYLQLRQIDAQKQLFDATLEAYRRSLELTRNRYQAGVAARLDVVQAETLWRSTQVQATALGVARAQLEHAIAASIGRPPSALSIDFAPLPATLPAVPAAGLPSALLERRPDIAGAERRMAATNASIGVAQAANFPSLTVAAGAGLAGSSLADLLSLPNRFWSLAPALAFNLFDGGARRAATAQAEAAYDASVANYRQTVISGFREVEDALAALRVLEEEALVQDQAVRAARLAVELVTNQYRAGLVSYLNVVTAQATALSNERNALSIRGDRIGALVSLVTALGGGFTQK